MRFWVITVVIAGLGCAWAQQKELASAPLPHYPTRALSVYSILLQQSVLPRTALQRSWYWEGNVLAPVPSLANKYLPKGVVTNNSDFSPASLHWTFTGKRKMMPTLDLTLVQIKPGEGSIRENPGAEPGGRGLDRGHLWDRATRSISDFLHTE